MCIQAAHKQLSPEYFPAACGVFYLRLMDLYLERFAYTPEGTFGRLRVDGSLFWTCELPWEGNQRRISCIPEGGYPLRMRDSAVVARTTGGEYTAGYEVCEVPGRSFIMIHPGNWASDVQGCIAPGLKWGPLAGKLAVMSSRTAFRRLMDGLPDGDHWLQVTHFVPEYP